MTILVDYTRLQTKE